MTESESPRVLDSLARAYYLTGDPAKAVSVQRRAIVLLGEIDSALHREMEAKLATYVAAAEEAGLNLEDES